MILCTLLSDARSEEAQPIANNQFKPVRIIIMWFICIREWTKVRSTQALMDLYPYTSLCLLNPKPWIVCIVIILHILLCNVRSKEAYSIAGHQFKHVKFNIRWSTCIQESSRAARSTRALMLLYSHRSFCLLYPKPWIICIVMIRHTLFCDMRS